MRNRVVVTPTTTSVRMLRNDRELRERVRSENELENASNSQRYRYAIARRIDARQKTGMSEKLLGKDDDPARGRR